MVDQPRDINWSSVFDKDFPERIASVKEPQREYLARTISYSERERNNRSLGARGEAFTFKFEKFRLTQAGSEELAKEVKWVSLNGGDGLGYDIRSFSLHQDDELFIEAMKLLAESISRSFYLK